MNALCDESLFVFRKRWSLINGLRLKEIRALRWTRIRRTSAFSVNERMWHSLFFLLLLSVCSSLCLMFSAASYFYKVSFCLCFILLVEKINWSDDIPCLTTCAQTLLFYFVLSSRLLGVTVLIMSFDRGNILMYGTFDRRQGCANLHCFCFCKTTQRKGVHLAKASSSFRIQDVALSLSTCLTERPFNFSPCWSDYSNGHLWDAVIRLLVVV